MLKIQCKIYRLQQFEKFWIYQPLVQSYIRASTIPTASKCELINQRAIIHVISY